MRNVALKGNKMYMYVYLLEHLEILLMETLETLLIGLKENFFIHITYLSIMSIALAFWTHSQKRKKQKREVLEKVILSARTLHYSKDLFELLSVEDGRISTDLKSELREKISKLSIAAEYASDVLNTDVEALKEKYIAHKGTSWFYLS